MSNQSKRIELDNRLRSIFQNVYYQPPESLKMKFPCVVYRRSQTTPFFSDNKKYLRRHEYSITVIDENPDSTYAEEIDSWVETRWVNSFSTQGLHHFVFDCYI